MTTLSPGLSAVRVQPWFTRTFAAVISTVQSPSGASPSATPSSLIEECGLIQRNWVTSPSMRITFVLSKAAVEWCASAGRLHQAPAVTIATIQMRF